MRRLRQKWSGGVWVSAAVMLLAAALCGCDSGDSPLSVSERGQVTVTTSPLSQEVGGRVAVPFEVGLAEVGGQVAADVWVSNVGNGDLTVSRIVLAYEGPDGEDGPSIVLASGTVAGQEVDLSAPIVLAPRPGGDDLILQVVFTRPADDVERAARLTIESDTRTESERAWTVDFVTVAGLPVANVSPAVVGFGAVGAAQTQDLPITVTNTGSERLELSSALLTGSPDFALLGAGGESFGPGDAISWDPPMEIERGEVRTLVVRFSPADPRPAEGRLDLFTNDPAHPTGIGVELRANEGTPCLTVAPLHVTFGPKRVGMKAVLPLELTNCGAVDVTLSAIELESIAGASGAFGLDANHLQVPQTLPVNSTTTVDLTYVPALAATIDAETGPVLDEALVRVTSDAFEPVIEVPVDGFGADGGCPVPVITILEGEQVIPQTKLHLFGDGSIAEVPIAKWQWSVEAPVGSVSSFIPSDTAENTTFTANLAGPYTFRLEVVDANGSEACVPAEVEVLVIPDEAIHVELLWHTPNDPDETDEGPEAGADLDLHFAQLDYAVGEIDGDGDGALDPWFDVLFDTFWFNKDPNWGSFDPSQDDDPGLDRDDTDGGGPENLNLNKPQSTTYGIAVHSWDDHDYGSSYATVRIYVYSLLAFEMTDVKMSPCDMWQVAEIEWPTAKITLKQTPSGDLDILPNYTTPSFPCGAWF